MLCNPRPPLRVCGPYYIYWHGSIRLTIPFQEAISTCVHLSSHLYSEVVLSLMAHPAMHSIGRRASRCGSTWIFTILIINTTRHTPMLCQVSYMSTTMSWHHIIRWYLSSIVTLYKLSLSLCHILYITSSCNKSYANSVTDTMSVGTKRNTTPSLSLPIYVPP